MKIATLRKKFKRVHDKGLAALKSGDYNALGDAIRAERDMIRSQRKLIEKTARRSLKGDD